MKYGLLSILFFIGGQFCFKAQSDTTIASKNTSIAIFYLDSTGKINQKPTKVIGNNIPYLVIFNLTNTNISIKLSEDAKVWSGFTLKPLSKELYRCDGIE